MTTLNNNMIVQHMKAHEEKNENLRELVKILKKESERNELHESNESLIRKLKRNRDDFEKEFL